MTQSSFSIKYSNLGYFQSYCDIYYANVNAKLSNWPFMTYAGAQSSVSN